jgi:sugar lactone lactonase YvrE
MLVVAGGTLALSPQAGATATSLQIFAGTIGHTSNPCATSGTAAAVELGKPVKMTTDSQGDVYITDIGCSALYKVTPAGVLSVVAGRPGNSSTTAPSLPAAATSVTLGSPQGVVVNSAGDIFLASFSPAGLYEILPNGTMTNVTTPGANPLDLASDNSGNLFIPTNAATVLKYSGGVLSTFYSTGLGLPNGVATDSAGNVYIADSTNNDVIEVSPTGTLVKVVAGTGSNTTPASTLTAPEGVATDASGDVFIATAVGRVYEVTSTGLFTPIAGNGTGTPSTTVPATSSPLYTPFGLTVDPFGNLYIADTNQGNGGVVEELPGVTTSTVPTPGTPTLSGGSVVFPWSAVTGATSYTLTIYVNGVAQTPITGLSYTLASPIAGASYSFTVAAVIGGVTGPASAQSSSVTVPSTSSSGYWTVGGDGGVFSFGPNFYGSTGGLTLNQPVVAMASTSDGKGYWFVAKDGGVFSYGDAAFHGSVPGVGVHVTNVVGMAADPATGGYWVVGSDGGVYAFGAPFDGSVPGLGQHLSNIVGIAATPDGGGYELVSATGAVYTFGDAKYQGGANTLAHLNAPIVGIAVNSATGGYWLAGSDGGVYSYGAPFEGSAGGTTLNKPVVGIAATRSGSGYDLVAADGGVFSYNAHFHGSMGGMPLNAPMVGIAVAG